MANCTGLTNAADIAMCAAYNMINLECDGLTYKEMNETTGFYQCTEYANPDVPMCGQLGAASALDTGNTAWILIATALVMIMTPGVGLFYAGLAGEESAGNTLLMSFGSMVVVSLQWFLFGYSFAFSRGTKGWGDFNFGAFSCVGPLPSAAYGGQIPHMLFAAFQLQFAQITPAIISGAVVGRMKFTSYLLFVFLWTTLVYDPLAHWTWSLVVNAEGGVDCGGFLCDLGALDFAGGGVIHISSGVAALVAAFVVGKRYNHGEPVKPHNTPLVIIGASFLWFGWFGFNSGSAGGAGAPAGYAFFNTHIAAAAASLTWMITEKLASGKVTASGAAVGAVAGLVVITPGCGFVEPWGAFVSGLIVSPICYFAVWAKGKCGVDDTLDAFAVHGVGGIVGGIATGLFAAEIVGGTAGAFYGDATPLGAQFADIAVSMAYSFTMTLIILMGIKFSPLGLRIDDELEQEGIDTSEHGGVSYVRN